MRIKRTFSKDAANKISNLLSSGLLSGIDNTKLDKILYFKNIKSTAEVIFEFLKKELNGLPIKQSDIIQARDINKRKQVLKYLECIDIYSILVQFLQIIIIIIIIIVIIII